MNDQNLVELTKRIENLEKMVFGQKNESKKPAINNSGKIDFALNERAFVKRFAFDKSGPKKFVLLLAYLLRGEMNKEVSLNEIKDKWNKMKGRALLGGGFNPFYTNEAKNRGWVDSSKRGFFKLTSEWKEVLSQ